MKRISYLSFALLCSCSSISQLNSMVLEASKTNPKKRHRLSQKILQLEEKINQFNPNAINDDDKFKQLKRLNLQLLASLKLKQATYQNHNNHGYRNCTTKIERLKNEGYGKTPPKDLTISTIHKGRLHTIEKEEEALKKQKQILEDKKLRAQKQFEQVILNKINKLLIFGKYDFEQLVIQLDTATHAWQKQHLQLMFEIKTLWFKSAEKNVALLEQLQNKIKSFTTNTYTQWLQDNATPDWLENFDSDKTRDLIYWKQLSQALDNIKGNISKLPTKSLKCENEISSFKHERIALLNKIMDLEKQLKTEPHNKKIKNTLERNIKLLLLNIRDEWASDKSDNKSHTSLYWIKYITEPKEQKNNKTKSQGQPLKPEQQKQTTSSLLSKIFAFFTRPFRH